ncbi:MAG TPA: DinB family protein [Thermoanaerobaculia bacterium]
MKTFLVTTLFLAAAVAAAKDSTPPTLKSILLEQLKTTHNVQDWFVPAKQSLEGLTVEQANWKDGKGNHSIAQLVVHITFWDQQNLAKFKGEKPSAYSGNNDETFAGNVDKTSWEAAVRQLDAVMTDWEKAIEAADDQKLQSWYSTIAHISAHNAYHTGQILYIRKQQGSWDASKGVK